MSEDAEGAPDRANGTRAPAHVARGGKLTEIRLAAGFLTILPVLPRAAVAPETSRRRSDGFRSSGLRSARCWRPRICC